MEERRIESDKFFELDVFDSEIIEKECKVTLGKCQHMAIRLSLSD